MGPPPAMGGGLSDIVDLPMGEEVGLLEEEKLKLCPMVKTRTQ